MSAPCFLGNSQPLVITWVVQKLIFAVGTDILWRRRSTVFFVTGKTAVALGLKRSLLNFDTCAAQVSQRYLSPASSGTFNRTLFESCRIPTETAVVYLLRVAPVVRATTLMQTASSGVALGAV